MIQYARIVISDPQIMALEIHLISKRYFNAINVPRNDQNTAHLIIL